jgi:hypothetical protein
MREADGAPQQVGLGIFLSIGAYVLYRTLLGEVRGMAGCKCELHFVA